MPAAAPDTPRKHAPPEERRAQILAAAFQCFAEKGYHAATMDDVVRVSGLSKGSLYWHFRSKDEVFLAIFDGFSEQIFAGLEEIAADDGPVLPGLRRFGDAMVEMAHEQGPMLGVWIEFFAHPRARERFAEVYVRSRRALGQIVARGIERGELRSLPVEPTAASLTAAVEGLLLQACVDEEFDVAAGWETLWQIMGEGLAA